MYSAIKIGGFALGIAACLLIALYIRNELSYDQHYPDGDRIFRVITVYKEDGALLGKQVWGEAPLARALKEDFPEVEKAGRYLSSELFGAGHAQVMRADKNESLYEEGIVFADQELLEIFRIPLIYGNIQTALSEPNAIVISHKKALKYFGEENPLGKILILNNNETKPYKITGVMEDIPSNVHFNYDFLLTLSGVEFWRGEQNFWGAQNYPTYVKLKKGSDAGQLEKKLSTIAEKYIIPDLKRRGYEDAEEMANILSYELQPVKDIHLANDISDGLYHGAMEYIYLFGGIAFFILLLACINFINLSTAKSANRAKEVGLRKTIGADRKNLIRQFLLESMLYSFLSFAIGLLLAAILLPYFNALADESLEIPFTEWWLLPLLLIAALLVGLLTGGYPAFYLSRFQPISVLKGTRSKGSKSAAMRSVLVVFQFTTSIVLIIGTLVIYQQMNFILHKKIGYKKDQVLLLHGTHTLGDKIKTLKEELYQLPQVKSVSISDYLPVSGTKRDQNSIWITGEPKENRYSAQIWEVDTDYINTMGMEITEGRDFSPKMASDSSAVIINETMAKKLNIQFPFGKGISNGTDYHVIGIVKDFHFTSLHGEIRPLFMILGNSPGIMSVRVNSGDMTGKIESISRLWESFAPNQPIRYTFLDDQYARMHEVVQRMGRIFTSFAILAIIVACLGLFALSSFISEQLGKEVSIRLVLGASFRSVFSLLTWDFIRLVLISIIIAAPIAWYMMQRWLEDFAYRIEIGWEVFLLASFLALCIALFTISSQSIRAALRNPAESLRA